MVSLSNYLISGAGLGFLGGVRVVGPPVNFKFSEHVPSQFIFREHSPDRLDKNFFRPFLRQGPIGHHFSPAKVVGVMIIFFGLGFFAGQADFFTIGDDDKITGVNIRGVSGFVFAHENHGDPNGQSSEDLIPGVADKPDR